jgi:pyrroline-5-carboxylate reductase
MIGFIGGGNMAEAIIGGIKEGRQNIVVSDKKEVCKVSDLILLAVKPQNMDEVVKEIRDLLHEEHLVVSIAAGIGLNWLCDNLQSRRVIRVMPNTPALVGEGMSVVSPAGEVSEEDIQRVMDIFGSIGDVIIMDETKMDAVTALSGSGPAFVAEFIEAMIEAGVREGIAYQEASRLVVQTVKGTVEMLKTGISTHEIKKMVTSPGGTTAEGLYRLQKGSLKATLKEAIEGARRRSQELSRG